MCHDLAMPEQIEDLAGSIADRVIKLQRENERVLAV